MSKYKKAKQKGLIHLETGIDLLVDRELTNQDIMVAIGMLTQLLAGAELLYADANKEKLKSMMNAYIDTIFEKVTK